MRVAAVICIRNEELHVQRCLRDFIASGIEVILVDNGSSDQSLSLARPFLGHGLLGIERLPWRGSFNLQAQLEFKQQVIATLPHDWVIHADADEWLCAPDPGRSLLDGINEADAGGYNCINFHELTFVARPQEDFAFPDYSALMRTYYFFQPWYPRLMRIWKKSANFENITGSGHNIISPKVVLFPREFYLRHYIMLSEEHVRKKYGERKYSEEELAKHGDRPFIRAESLTVRQNPALRELPFPASRAFDLSAPVLQHFWNWPQDE